MFDFRRSFSPLPLDGYPHFSWDLVSGLFLSHSDLQLHSYVTFDIPPPKTSCQFRLWHPNVNGLQILVDRGFSADTVLLVISFSLAWIDDVIKWFQHFNLYQNANFGVFKQLGDMLRSNPKLRCNTTAGCLEMFKNGPYVYIHVRTYTLFLNAYQLKYHWNFLVRVICFKCDCARFEINEWMSLFNSKLLSG